MTHKTEKVAPGPPKSAADWEKIEGDYRAGMKTLRAIAAEHDISESYIRKRAKAEKWLRDLTERVRVVAKAHILRGSVYSRGPLNPDRPRRSEAEVVAEAAATQADIVLGHRKRLVRLRDVADKAAAHLDVIADDPTMLGAILDALGDLTSTTATLIKLERQAFNIDGERDLGEGARVYRIERVIIDVANPDSAGIPSAA